MESESSSRESFYEYYKAAGLELPRIPRGLKPHLREWGDWFLATLPEPDGFEDYRMHTVDMLKAPVADQFALSHAGHGISSYSLNLRMAIGDLALLVQVGWGGAYGDPIRETGDWNELMADVSEILKRFDLKRKPGWRQRKFLVTYSSFRLEHGSRAVLEMFEDGKWIPLIATGHFFELIDELDQHVGGSAN